MEYIFFFKLIYILIPFKFMNAQIIFLYFNFDINNNMSKKLCCKILAPNSITNMKVIFLMAK